MSQVKPEDKNGLTWSHVGAIALILIFVTTLIVHSQDRPSTSSDGPSGRAVASQFVIPGLPEDAYTVGLADHFAALEGTPAACTGWNKLPEAEKRGLAFVSANVVPACANPSYVALAKAEQKQRSSSGADEGIDGGQAVYFDLGHLGVANAWPGKSYSCKELKNLTAYNYDPPVVPKSDQYAENQTPAQAKAWSNYNAETYWVYSLEQMYALGGNFQGGCYPPGMVVGANYSVTFYPNAPVSSLRETPVPVFKSPGGCNVCNVGAVYTVKAKDTLGKIATCYYGDPDQWQLLVATNHVRKVTDLQIGTKLHLLGVTNVHQKCQTSIWPS